MNILWLFVVIHSAFAQPGFGRSYLRNSRLCHQWSCLNTNLGLPDSLPTSEQFSNVLRRLLPEDWQGVVENVVDTCYNNRPRRYTNTCPGQAIVHCTVDQLIYNCPEASLRKEDACAPVNSIAGFNIMFTQSRYENLEKNMAFERRPAWFLNNYFNTKCCNLPVLFNSTLLTQCGFTSMIEYYIHNPQYQRNVVLPSQRRIGAVTANNGDSLQVVTLNPTTDNTPVTDPLECCDLSPFIKPSWRQECNFGLTWEDQRRLVINNEGAETTTAAPVTTTTARPARKDLTIVPQSCEKEACVFTKLNILNDSGTVDLEAFTKLLDNLTNSQPSWTSAKGRVLTTCLRKPITDYDEKCEINNLLACTFDVLTENCPNATKSDLCKHTKSDRICQISSSKSRPKNRRDTCILPELVDRKILTECGLNSLSKVKLVQSGIQTKKYHIFSSRYKCQDLTPSTSCILSKMGVLNKYGFTDYFKMKDHIRQFAQNEWSSLVNLYLDTFISGPLYREHCNSPKKFLNVIESMLMTCPASKRKDAEQCRNIFNKIANTPANNGTVEHVDQILKHFHHVFYPLTTNQPHKFIRPKYTKKLVKKPIYDYGILSDKYAPKVATIQVPKKVERPLVLLPVYMRIPNTNLAVRPFREDGIMRSAFWLHNPITQAHVSTTAQPNILPNSTKLPQPLYKPK